MRKRASARPAPSPRGTSSACARRSLSRRRGPCPASCVRGLSASREALGPPLAEPQHPAHLTSVGPRERVGLAEPTLALRGLLLEQVALHRAPPQDLPRSRQLEALLRCSRRLLLWHLSLLLRSSSAPAPSPCSARRGVAVTRRRRAPSRPPPAASADSGPAPDGWSPSPGT